MRKLSIKSLETFMVMVYNTADPPELFGQVVIYKHDHLLRRLVNYLFKESLISRIPNKKNE